MLIYKGCSNSPRLHISGDTRHTGITAFCMQNVDMIVFSVYTSVSKNIRKIKNKHRLLQIDDIDTKNAPAETGAFFIVLIREKILDLTVMIVFVADAS